jgi:hypothetical protein
MSLVSNTYQDGNTYNEINNLFENNNNTNEEKRVINDKGREQLLYTSYDKTIHSETNCPITFEEFKEDEIIVKLPCSHYFSKKAIETWLFEKSAYCPLCKFELPYKTIKNISSQTFIEIIYCIEDYIERREILNIDDDLYRSEEEEERDDYYSVSTYDSSSSDEE